MSEPIKSTKTALIVHSDMSVLSAFQSSFVSKGYVAILARDLPTALLALTQHFFEAGSEVGLSCIVLLFVPLRTPQSITKVLSNFVRTGNVKSYFGKVVRP